MPLPLLSRLFAITLLLSATGWSAAAKKSSSGLPPDACELKLGDAAPDFRLLGIDGKHHTLPDYKAAKLLMVVFLSNQYFTKR